MKGVYLKGFVICLFLNLGILGTAMSDLNLGYIIASAYEMEGGTASMTQGATAMTSSYFFATASGAIAAAEYGAAAGAIVGPAGGLIGGLFGLV